MVLYSPALPFGLRDIRLYPVNSDGSIGAGVDLPAAQTFTFTDQETFAELMGDDKTFAAHGNGPTVAWELDAGGISIAAYQILAGGASALTGTTPNQINTYTKGVYDQRPYFQVEGQAISDSGGDLHCRVYRCKATGDIEGSFANGAFALTKAKGVGYGDTFGAAPTNKLYVFVQNETAVAIP